MSSDPFAVVSRREGIADQDVVNLSQYENISAQRALTDNGTFLSNNQTFKWSLGESSWIPNKTYFKFRFEVTTPCLKDGVDAAD